MIKFPTDINFDFSKVKSIRLDDKCTVYELENLRLKLYDGDVNDIQQIKFKELNKNTAKK